MTRISAVCFDAGNTLLFCDPSVADIYSEALGRHGRPVRADEVAPVFSGVWAELQEQSPPGIDRYGSYPGGEKMWWGAFLREVLRRLGHDAAWEPLLDDLFEAFSRTEVWKAFPDTVPTLERLRDRGVQLAVISNWDRRLPAILDGLGLTPFFDTVTVSSIEGVEKPAPAIFARTLERLGARAETTIHIGDSPLEDYEGSEGAGMIPVLIDRHGAFGINGYRRVESLGELVALID